MAYVLLFRQIVLPARSQAEGVESGMDVRPLLAPSAPFARLRCLCTLHELCILG
jgi:hypothetical protein